MRILFIQVCIGLAMLLSLVALNQSISMLGIIIAKEKSNLVFVRTVILFLLIVFILGLSVFGLFTIS